MRCIWQDEANDSALGNNYVPSWGMAIAVEPEYWQQWQAYSQAELAQQLLDLATRVDLKTLLKQPRAPKRKKPPLIVDRRRRHLSTQRLLDQQAVSP